ncbi:MAG: response regulator [Pseudolabrys sp.]|jgi:DNA-binding response OmpR family regulator
MPETAKAAESPKPPARILVVEDEYLIRMLLEDMLSDIGHEVTATCGNLETAREAALAGGFDVAILDVNLEGQVVFPVAEILAQQNLPFVFVTGYGEGALPEGLRDRPTLQKPFQSEKLEATLKSLLASAANPEAPQAAS